MAEREKGRETDRQSGEEESEGRQGIFLLFFSYYINSLFFISVIIYVRDLVNYNLVHVVCKTLLISPCSVKTIK